MLLIAGLLALTVLFIWLQFRRTSQYPVPPGPKPLPLVGNIFDLTAKELWRRVTDWAQQYGDIVYIHVFGQGLVFINSPEIALELLERRGAIYSDKPPLVMAGELCGCEHMVAFARYGDYSRRQRRLMTQALGAGAIRTYYPLIEAETHALLKRILGDPQDYLSYVRRYAGGLTLNTIYGYNPETRDDKFLRLANESVDLLSNHIASGGGIWPVDVFPFLRYLPTWFPGASFKRKAIVWKAQLQEFVDQPYAYVLDCMKSGNYVPSFVSTILEELDREKGGLDAQQAFDIRWTANSMYSGSLDTTIMSVQFFILAVLERPEILRKVQKEMDSVVGTSRLPRFSDRPSLPYLECVMSEVLRWGTPVPLGLPHRLTEDDVYNGMHIPKGSLVFANIWMMLHNESLYPNPNVFDPDRFLVEADEATVKRRDPRNYVFGFGRRRCPGLNLVESSLWMALASMVATFDISKAKDKHGREIEPVVSYDNSVFRTPSPFPCDIRPRSEQALRNVRQATEAM